MSKKKDLIAENEKLKSDLADITEQLGKTPEDLKKDFEEKQALEKEIEENKKLLKQAEDKANKLKASALGGEQHTKISDEKFKETKNKLKAILGG